MGRIKMGSQPESKTHEYEIHGAGRRYTSRRNPNGMYDIVGVAAGAPKAEIMERLRAETKLARDQSKNGKSRQAKAAGTVRLRTLLDIAAELNCNDTALKRLHRYRARLSPKRKKLNNAKDVMRRKFKVRVLTGALGPNWARPTRAQKGMQVDSDGVDGKVVGFLPANINNTTTAVYVVAKRSRQSLRADKRLSTHAVLPGEAV